MTAVLPSQPGQDRKAARELLREIVDSDMYPAQHRISAAKSLLETDPTSTEGQELLAMSLTDEQLVDIIARAQAAEKVAPPPPPPTPTEPFHVEQSAAPPAPASPTLAERLAGLASLAARPAAVRSDEDPICW